MRAEHGEKRADAVDVVFSWRRLTCTLIRGPVAPSGSV